MAHHSLTLLVAALFAAVIATPAAASFSFASLGDWGCVPIGGYHERDEIVVARQFASAAEDVNARFILNPGDNFYYCGVHSKDDSMWNSTFESVFTEPSTMVPWYTALGNHDYGYPGSATAQMEYVSPNNNRWVLPARYYYKRLEFPGEVNISLVVLDASPCQQDYISNDPSGWDPCGSVIPGCPGCTFHQNVIKQSCAAQLEWLNSILPTVPADDWKIAMVHAPASDIDVLDMITPFQNANFNLYLNGHVHLLAHYQIDNMGTYITSGAGCMVRVPESDKKTLSPGTVVPPKLRASSCRDNPKFHSCEIIWQKTIAGYTTHTFNANFSALTTYIYDYAGKLLHTVVTEKDGGSGSGSTPSAPSSGGSSSSSSGGTCCHYSDSPCYAGQICCNDEGSSYHKSACDGWQGKKHHCKWTDSECVIPSSSSSSGSSSSDSSSTGDE